MLFRSKRLISSGKRLAFTTSDISFFIIFFNDTATTEIYTLSLHDALRSTEGDCRYESKTKDFRKKCNVITNTGGEVIGCIIVERDFEDKDCVELYSDIKQFDAELYSGIELQNIGEYTNDAIIVFDMQGICTYAL